MHSFRVVLLVISATFLIVSCGTSTSTAAVTGLGMTSDIAIVE
jgi:hypothetical protein